MKITEFRKLARYYKSHVQIRNQVVFDEKVVRGESSNVEEWSFITLIFSSVGSSTRRSYLTLPYVAHPEVFYNLDKYHSTTTEMYRESVIWLSLIQEMDEDLNIHLMEEDPKSHPHSEWKENALGAIERDGMLAEYTPFLVDFCQTIGRVVYSEVDFHVGNVSHWRNGLTVKSTDHRSAEQYFNEMYNISKQRFPMIDEKTNPSSSLEDLFFQRTFPDCALSETPSCGVVTSKASASPLGLSTLEFSP